MSDDSYSSRSPGPGVLDKLHPRHWDETAIPKIMGLALIPPGSIVFRGKMARLPAPGFFQKMRLASTSLAISSTGASMANYLPSITLDRERGIVFDDASPYDKIALSIRKEHVYAVGLLALYAAGRRLLRPPSYGQVFSTFFNATTRAAKFAHAKSHYASKLPEAIAYSGFGVMSAFVLPNMIADLLEPPEPSEKKGINYTELVLNSHAALLVAGGMKQAIPVLTGKLGPVLPSDNMPTRPRARAAPRRPTQPSPSC